MSRRLHGLAALLFLLATHAWSAAPPAELVRAVFPGAETVGPAAGEPPAMPVFAGGRSLGWVFFSHDTVNSTGFSGRPIDLLIGLDRRGVITGARVVEHHEPILAIGIDEARLRAFTDQYRGRDVRQVARIGARDGIDGISGASISSLVLNDAVMRAARAVARAQGLLADGAGALDTEREARADWTALLADGALAHLGVTEAVLARRLPGSAPPGASPDAPFIDLYAALLNPAGIGRNLLGDAGYAQLMARLPTGAGALLIAANGRFSFKGTGFVRSGVFDRVQIVQGATTFRLRVESHERLETLAAAGAPELREIGVFVLPPDSGFDPAQPWRLDLLVATPGDAAAVFTLPYRLPARYLRAAEPPAPLWQEAWHERQVAVALVGLMLAVLTVVLFAQDVIVRRIRLLRPLRLSMLAATLLGLGWWAGAQLSVLNTLTFINALLTGFRWDFFLLDPLMFVLWSFVGLALMFWGRGVFCGWLCPFGALQEFVATAASRLRLPQWRLPFGLHERLWTLKYVVFVGLLALSLQSLEAAQPWAEVEPFKTAIVLRFARAWPFVLYALLLLAGSLFVERAFCRYLCPLGGALALPARLRMFEWLKRRPQCGRECHICASRCPVQAIHPDGHINVHECINCLGCQALYHDDHVCPPLIERRRRRAARAAAGGGAP